MVRRDLAMIKVMATAENRAEIMQMVDVFRAHIVDVTSSSMIVEITGDEEKINGFIEVMRPQGIIEMVRTGSVAMGRGTNSLLAGIGSYASMYAVSRFIILLMVCDRGQGFGDISKFIARSTRHPNQDLGRFSALCAENPPVLSYSPPLRGGARGGVKICRQTDIQLMVLAVFTKTHLTNL